MRPEHPNTLFAAPRALRSGQLLRERTRGPWRPTRSSRRPSSPTSGAASRRRRARRRPGALHRPVPDARRAHAPRGGPDRRAATPSRRASARLGGGDGFADVWKRGLLRLGVQGQGQGPEGRLPPAARATATTWSNPPLLVVSRPRRDRDPHQLHQPQPGLYGRHARRPGGRRPVRARCAILRAVFTAPEELRPRHRAGRDHREAAAPLRRARPEPARARPRPASASPTSWTASCSACSPRTPACCRRASSRAWPRRRTAGPTSSRTPCGELFAKMAHGGGLFGTEEIDWFNGGLFDSGDVLPLTGAEISDAARGRPAQLGAHRARDLRHPVRARPGPRPARPARRPLHGPRRHLAARRAGGHAPAAARVRRDAGARDRAPAVRPEGHEGDAARPRTRGRLRGLPRSPATRPRARPRLRLAATSCIVTLWALKDLEWEAIQWGSLVLRAPHADPADRARGGPGHRDQRLRRRAGPGDDLDRRDPVDDPPRPGLRPRPDPARRSTTSRTATRCST